MTNASGWGRQVALSAIDAASSATPSLGMIALAGCAIALVGALLMLVTRRSSFATRATALQACVVVLLVVSILALLPRIDTGIAAPVSSLVRDALTPPAAVTAPMARLGEWSRMTDPAPTGARTGVAVAIIVWMAGAALSLLRLLRGAIMLRGIRRRARASAEHSVLVSDEVDIPFVVGIRAPAIVVPASSESWSSADWTAVLHHELSHVARGDVLALWLRQLALAIHWWNPAVRWLARQADDACEGACDDAVLLGGTRVESYAETLLSFTSAGGRVPAAPAPTMARRSGLERRVLAMLHHRRRRAPAWRDRVAPRIIGMCCGVSVAVALPQPVVVAAQIEQAVRVQSARPIDATGPAAIPKSPVTRPTANDTTEALLGLAALLEDPNPIVRASASDALRAWRSASPAHLLPVANGSDATLRKRARAALSILEVTP